MNVERFLNRQHVPFEMIPHSETFTAQQTAHVLNVPDKNMAKTVVLQADDKFLLAVLPATRQIDIDKVQQHTHAAGTQLADESELKSLFGDCELGAVPPFGSQYGLPTIVDESLTDDEHIVFDGNTHDQAVYMRYADYDRIEHPQVAAISR